MHVVSKYFNNTDTVIPRLTSDPANDFFFPAVFRTRLTNMDSAN